MDNHPILLKFLDSPRVTKRLISVVFDALSIIISSGLALMIASKGGIDWSISYLLLITVTLIPSLVVFVYLGFYRAILRYAGAKTIMSLFFGIFASVSFFFISAWKMYDSILIVESLIMWTFLTITIGGARLLMKAIIEGINRREENVAIYGAGSAGRQLASALNQGNKYRPVVFVDDDESIQYSKINNIEVIPFKKLGSKISKDFISSVLLALPSTSHARKSDILVSLEPFPVKVKTIAGMEDIVSGKSKIEEVRDIEIEDLLGRDSINPDDNLLRSCISRKVVMVTGAGGSIGSELCRQILSLDPKTLVLYELSEFALYSIERELTEFACQNDLDVTIVPLMGSVQHKNRLINAMQLYSVQTVYHAAAYKHVPIVEHNIVEGIRNNVFGSWYAAEAAVETGVERFVLVSTDKAVRPTNIMGASKRVAELVLQGINQRKVSTIFTMVRFGNVLGSSGSVVPLFRQQINSGGPVTVTHKDIIRYFMTIPEAAQLVIQAGAMGKGGDVFVLDMGEQVRIAELAERMIHLMGYTVKNKEHPQGDIEIQYSGLRPGEKLYEELLVGENVVGTEHPKIMTASEESLAWLDMQRALILLNELCEEMNCEGIVQLLLKMPTGYNPQHAVCDLLWDEDKNKNNVLRFKTLS